MRTMKYVLDEVSETFLIFPETMTHANVPGTWTNAGFIKFTTDSKDVCGNIILKPKCSGHSVSLQLSSGPRDEEIIYRGMKNNW